MSMVRPLRWDLRSSRDVLLESNEAKFRLKRLLRQRIGDILLSRWSIKGRHPVRAYTRHCKFHSFTLFNFTVLHFYVDTTKVCKGVAGSFRSSLCGRRSTVSWFNTRTTTQSNWLVLQFYFKIPTSCHFFPQWYNDFRNHN